MENKIPQYLYKIADYKYNLAEIKWTKLSFLDKTILNSSKAVKSIYLQAENAARDNFIQKINPNLKLISLIYMAIVISVVSNLVAQILITAFILILFIIARLKLFDVYRKIFFLAFVFGFIVVLPAALNVITPGKIIFNIIKFNKPSHFLIYDIPQNIGFTINGFQVVSIVFLRVLNSVSFALLVVFTTPFPSFIKSFKMIGIPDTILMIISLAYKYIFILSRTIEETYFAFRSRLSGNVKSASIRKLIGGRIFFIFKRSTLIYQNTYDAMVSRGYKGKITLHSQNHFTFKDLAVLVIITLSGIIFLLFKK
jgi:cobalt/nickel transport system permease protein